jgi:hypothetical protein
MSELRALVEYVHRHEFGRPSDVLTRPLTKRHE